MNPTTRNEYVASVLVILAKQISANSAARTRGNKVALRLRYDAVISYHETP